MKIISIKKRILVIISTIAVLFVLSTSVYAVSGFIHSDTTMETLGDNLSFRMRQIYVNGIGFLSADFAWNEESMAWVFNGNYFLEGPATAGMQLWLNYGENPSPTSEKLEVWVVGANIVNISFVSPGGATYSNFSLDESFMGVDIYHFEKSDLPVGQSEFTDGEYAFTITFLSGPPLEKSFYLSGAKPLSFKITYPENGDVDIPINPKVTWEAVGAGSYDFIVRDGDSEIYNTLIMNSIDVSLSHTIPQGVLSPNTAYSLTIEAQSPVVNGGQKGIKKKVNFTTTP